MELIVKIVHQLNVQACKCKKEKCILLIDNLVIKTDKAFRETEPKKEYEYKEYGY